MSSNGSKVEKQIDSFISKFNKELKNYYQSLIPDQNIRKNWVEHSKSINYVYNMNAEMMALAFTYLYKSDIIDNTKYKLPDNAPYVMEISEIPLKNKVLNYLTITPINENIVNDIIRDVQSRKTISTTTSTSSDLSKWFNKPIIKSKIKMEIVAYGYKIINTYK